MKITFMGAGSTVFAKNVLGDVMTNEVLRECEIALYDIDAQRLEASNIVLTSINEIIPAPRGLSIQVAANLPIWGRFTACISGFE